MALSRFTRSDLIYFRKAFAAPTHSQMNDLDTLFEQKTDADNATKAMRATRLIDLIEKRADSDEALLEALNILYVDNYSHDQRHRMPEFNALVIKVLAPRGVLFDENKGYNFETGTLASEDVDSEPKVPMFDQYFNQTPVGVARAPQAWGSTAQAASTPATTSPAPQATQAVAPAAESQTAAQAASPRPNSVFIVQGRDERPVAALETFIHFLGMDVITWGDARRMTGVAQPETFQIVKTGLEQSGAVIVIFSPDEEARLRAELTGLEDADGKPVPGVPGFQPRQNVLLEAGLAFGLAPGRTIFVRSSGSMRDISDIVGFNFITMDGSWEQREALSDALKAAGTTPVPKRKNLTDRSAGPFVVR